MCSSEFLAHLSAPNVGILNIPFIDINPFRPNYLAARTPLLVPWGSVINTKLMEESHLCPSSLVHSCRIQQSSTDVVDRVFNTILGVKRHHAVIKVPFSNSAFAQTINVVALGLVNRINPVTIGQLPAGLDTSF